ncbi:hypothetical protein V6N13_065638 [Hibiscus sabdariffa]
MHPGLNEWDERKVQQVFLEPDTTTILNCPIARSGNMKIWGHHSSGAYTTRSGYNWLLNSENFSQNIMSLWRVIAKLPVLPKIRIFGQRLGHNSLPVGQKVNAAQLGPGRCKLCEKDTETLLHAMRECQQVQTVLKVNGMDEILPQGPFVTCMEWLIECWHILESTQFTFLIVLL